MTAALSVLILPDVLGHFTILVVANYLSLQAVFHARSQTVLLKCKHLVRAALYSMLVMVTAALLQ